MKSAVSSKLDIYLSLVEFRIVLCPVRNCPSFFFLCVCLLAVCKSVKHKERILAVSVAFHVSMNEHSCQVYPHVYNKRTVAITRSNVYTARNLDKK